MLVGKFNPVTTGTICKLESLTKGIALISELTAHAIINPTKIRRISNGCSEIEEKVERRFENRITNNNLVNKSFNYFSVINRR